jgi:excisionase family DNA binding protein
MEELWDIERVAAYLGVSERTVYNRVRAGELRAVKVGRLWRVKPSDLEAWLGGRSPDGPGYAPAEVVGPYPYESPTAVVGVAEAAGLPPRIALDAAVGASDDLLVRRLSFVALLTKGVVALGWSAPVVVGGHAVEFYTAGDYPTQDIDLAAASEPVAEVLDTWGFERQGRHWYDSSLGIVVEVPGGSLSPGERAHVVSVEVAGAIAYVLGIEDLIIDRLAACKQWTDEESCRWARVLAKGAIDLDLAYLVERSREEDVEDVLAGLDIEGLSGKTSQGER